MAEMKNYIVQPQEGGSIQISEDVVAVREVEGVYGLSTTPTFDISSLLGKKNLRNGIQVVIDGESIEISCNLVVKLGEAVMTVAKNVQDSIVNEVFSMTGVRPAAVNINVCGIAIPKTGK